MTLKVLKCNEDYSYSTAYNEDYSYSTALTGIISLKSLMAFACKNY